MIHAGLDVGINFFDTADAFANDELTVPSPLYPNWFIENLADSQHKTTLKPIELS